MDNDWRAIALAHNGPVGIVSGRASEARRWRRRQRMREGGGMECAVLAIGPFVVAPK